MHERVVTKVVICVQRIRISTQKCQEVVHAKLRVWKAYFNANSSFQLRRG